MYDVLKSKPLPNQVEYLTRKLVEQPSINGTEGEAKKANMIKGWLETFPYFQQHPDHLWFQEIPDDRLGRKNVFAFVQGHNKAKETLLYHGHIDTVGVEDYGKLEEKAFNPDELMTFFSDSDLDPTLKEEARSGEWLFGRGALDMQSGDAVHIANLLYFSEHQEEMNGNLLVMFNPDEEAEHQGIITAISELKRLKEEEGLVYLGAINSDFSSPLYEGDETRYLYTGAAGKLLPSFYIYGRESHVGETLKGIDSTLVASEINRRLNNNMDLTEPIEGEVVLPPSCLYQRDLKEAYNVQIPFKSCMYFNYFLYEENPITVLDKVAKIAREACDKVEERLSYHYKKYIESTAMPESDVSWHLEVITLKDFISKLKESGIDTDEIVEKVLKENEGEELRELSFKVVDALQQHDRDQRPRVIVFYGPPHCPHNYLKEDDPRDRLIYETMEQIVEEVGEENTFSIKRFFPFLSDSSYLNLHESDEELALLESNFAFWNDRYNIPVKDIRSLSIPAINMGVFGKDAHQWTERLYKPYSFSTLPLLIRRFTKVMLAEPVKILS
ncbi:MAG TPA: M20/M25/M40 family metallo-hydrolase [Bacillales bacterium]|nr:M20/M25/M40 family metallo-hydrolase [Bacillales bacterium]